MSRDSMRSKYVGTVDNHDANRTTTKNNRPSTLFCHFRSDTISGRASAHLPGCGRLLSLYLRGECSGTTKNDTPKNNAVKTITYFGVQ